MAILLLILGLLLFVGLVVVHEFGHFIAARRNDIEVEEFGVGFPPRAKVLTKRHGTVFTLNWLPLGGFVRLKGEHDADREAGTFGAASLKAKVKVMLAGVGMNLLVAYILFTALAFIGMPQLVDNQFTVKSDTKVVTQQVLVGYVEPDSPAAKAGLQSEDRLVSITDTNPNCVGLNQCIDMHTKTTSITKADDFPHVTKELAGKNVQLHIIRNGTAQTKVVALRSTAEVEDSKKTGNPKGYLGVAPTEYIVQRSTWSAPVVGAGVIGQYTVLTFKGLGSALGNLFKGNTAAASEQVSGPVGIFVVLKDGSLLGANFTLMIIAVISLTLAIMNVLPIPALDGGRLFVILAFRAFRKPLRQHTEEAIQATGFAALMLLVVLITVVDIRRFF